MKILVVEAKEAIVAVQQNVRLEMPTTYARIPFEHHPGFTVGSRDDVYDPLAPGLRVPRAGSVEQQQRNIA